MNRNIRVVACALILFCYIWIIPAQSIGQANASRPQQAVSPEVEIEKMRIEAQERIRREVEQKDWQTQIFDVRYADLSSLRNALSLFPAVTNTSDSPRMISVKAPKDVMSAIEAVIKRFDAPPKNVELTIFVLNASNQPSTTTLPQNLQPVINQLRNVFSYKAFDLVDTEVVRGRDGSDAMTQGLLPQSGNMPAGGVYQFSSRFSVQASDQNAPVLQLDRMQFSVTIPPATPGLLPYQNVSIRTRVDIPRGQQVVVGKATLGESALILVMSAKFVD